MKRYVVETCPKTSAYLIMDMTNFDYLMDEFQSKARAEAEANALNEVEDYKASTRSRVR
jgi:hypothetical protein